MENPTTVKEIAFDYIFGYIQAKGKQDKSWLKKLCSQKVKNEKSGAERDITFIEIRNEFAKKYMPEIIPPPKKKVPTMKEKLALL